MRIASFEDFVNESKSYSAGSFIDTAVKALEDEGFLVSVNSTPIQIKNDNLNCILMYPKSYELLKLYNLDESNILIFDGSTIKDFFDNLETKPLTIFKIGNVMFDGEQKNNSITFKSGNGISTDALVERMKTLFMKEFIKQTSRLRYRLDPSAPSRLKYMIISDNLKLIDSSYERHPSYSLSLKKREIRSYPLPQNLLELCDKVHNGFKKEYEAVAEKFPDYMSLFSDTIAANVAPLVLEGINLPFSPFNMRAVSTLDSSLRLFSYKDSISIMAYNYWALSSENSKKVIEEIEKLWEKIRKMNPEEIDEYYKDFYTRKRGTISGKKFGL
jgi:hypothetical protein